MTVYEIKGNDAIEKIKKVLNRYGISDADINGIILVEAEFRKGREGNYFRRCFKANIFPKLYN
jgi:RecA-family ATPase